MFQSPRFSTEDAQLNKTRRKCYFISTFLVSIEKPKRANAKRLFKLDYAALYLEEIVRIERHCCRIFSLYQSRSVMTELIFLIFLNGSFIIDWNNPADELEQTVPRKAFLKCTNRLFYKASITS